MKVCKTLIIFFAISAVMLSTARAAVEFSARLLLLPKGASSQQLSGRLFVKGEKVRQETSGPNGIRIMIFRPDIKVTWMLTGPGKAWLQMDYLPSDNGFEQWTPIKSYNAQYLGKETVHSMPCRKYQTDEDGRKTAYWVSERFSFPVRIDNQDETIECTNVNQANLADSLFEIPAEGKKEITRIAPPRE